MTRLLILALLIYLLWRGLSGLARSLGLDAGTRRRVRPGGPYGGQTYSRPHGDRGERQIGEELVRCARCGAHFPASRGVSTAEGWCCSTDCRPREAGGGPS